MSNVDKGLQTVRETIGSVAHNLPEGEQKDALIEYCEGIYKLGVLSERMDKIPGTKILLICAMVSWGRLLFFNIWGY